MSLFMNLSNMFLQENFRVTAAKPLNHHLVLEIKESE